MNLGVKVWFLTHKWPISFWDQSILFQQYLMCMINCFWISEVTLMFNFSNLWKLPCSTRYLRLQGIGSIPNYGPSPLDSSKIKIQWLHFHMLFEFPSELFLHAFFLTLTITASSCTYSNNNPYKLSAGFVISLLDLQQRSWNSPQKFKPS